MGDIHANFPALQAIWSYVQEYRFDRIVNTGDFTVYSTFPNETIQWFLKRKNSVSILGNTDRRILRILKGKNLKRPKKEEKRIMYYWTAETLLPENVQYLKSLPRQTELTINDIRIGVFHGTCDDEDETLFPDTPESRFRELAKGSPFRVHIMGHSHTPYYKIIDGIHFINPGSVGRMFDGDPRTVFRNSQALLRRNIRRTFSHPLSGRRGDHWTQTKSPSGYLCENVPHGEETKLIRTLNMYVVILNNCVYRVIVS